MDDNEDFPGQESKIDGVDHYNPEGGGYRPPEGQARAESPLGGSKVESSNKAPLIPPIIERLENLGLEEVHAEGKSAHARVIGPAYMAFMDTAKGLPKPDVVISGRLNSLKNQALRAATRVHEQNTFPGQDLEFCFSKIVNEEVFPNLRENEQEALTQASDQEVHRQKQKSNDGSGFAMAIKVSPERMLKTLLWSIRDIQ